MSGNGCSLVTQIRTDCVNVATWLTGLVTFDERCRPFACLEDFQNGPLLSLLPLSWQCQLQNKGQSELQGSRSEHRSRQWTGGENQTPGQGDREGRLCVITGLLRCPLWPEACGLPGPHAGLSNRRGGHQTEGVSFFCCCLSIIFSMLPSGAGLEKALKCPPAYADRNSVFLIFS